MKKPPKNKSNAEPSLRDKLSQGFLKAFEEDFQINGIEAIQQLRKRSPEKFCEIATRLIAAHEPKSDGFDQAKSAQELARKLLRAQLLKRLGHKVMQAQTSMGTRAHRGY
jgi:hypothetical protein